MATKKEQPKEQPKVEVVKSAAEYFYAESLRQMNTHRLSVGLPVVSTTQGRKLHDVYMNVFDTLLAPDGPVDKAIHGPGAPTDKEQLNRRMTGQLMGAMSYAFSESMRDVNGGKAYYNLTVQSQDLRTGMDSESNAYLLGYNDSKALAQRTILNFKQHTGWELGYAKEYENGDMSPSVEKPRYPLSPYDPAVSMRRVMLDNGGRVLWADASQLLSGDHRLRLDTEDNLNVYAEEYDAYGAPTGNFAYRGKLNHPDDISGLSRLRPYMSDTEYKSIQPIIAQAGTKYSNEALEKSVAILQWLTDNGYQYSIQNDTNPGQVKARIGNSKLEIRILDSGKNEAYIGRCYEEGYSTYYSNKSSKSGPTIDDTLRLISYTLGNQVERTTYNAGEVSHVRQTDRFGNVYYNNQRGVKRASDEVGRYAGEPANLFFSASKDKVTGKVKDINVHQDGLVQPEEGSTAYPNSQVLMDVVLGVDNGRYVKREFKVAKILSQHHATHEYFDTPEDAKVFVEQAIQTARENYLEKLDMPRLMQEAKDHQGQPDYVPELSYDPEIAPIQLQYWEVLSGKRDLYKAGMTVEQVRDDMETEGTAVDMLMGAIFGDAAKGRYTGTLEEQVQQHIEDSLNLEFGTFEPSDEDGLRFHPGNVAKFMTSSFGQFRNNDNLVEAMKTLEMDANELRGGEFQTNQIKDKLIRFNPENARQMGGEDASDFMKVLAKTVQETIATSHCVVNPEDILIDDNGIVHYSAQRIMMDKDGKSNWMQPVEGEIGQIFEPDEDGVVETQFNGSPNQLFSPGYLAYVLPQKDGESKTLPERMRLKGYTHVLQENIRRQIRRDLLDPHERVGTTTNINNSYRGLYENRYKVHGEVQRGETLKEAYIRECRMTGLPDDAIEARFATFKGMVRLPSSFKDGSSLNAAFARSREGMAEVEDIMNDNARDAWQLSGGENISVLSEDWDGYTDKTATGSAKNQGVVRYLVEGASVDAEGRMVPARKEDGSIDKDARTALMSLPYMKYVDYTPFDRQQMVFSNLSGASAIDAHTGVATMTMGGYTFDDGAVISAKWAMENGPLGEDGERRPIGVGDKILDCAGNKSIVGKVIDPTMPTEEFDKLSDAEKQMVVFFNDNPQVSVVMSPYSPMSRFNATSARFAMEDNFEITLPDGSVTYGGYMPMIVTDKTVDEKTKEYGDDEVKAGGGRSASGQFNWILSGVGAYGLMDECYGNNESSLANYREYLITMGMDIDQTGTLGLGYKAHQGESRHYFELPAPEELDALTRKSAAEMFRGAVDNRGGFLEIPVQLTLPSGEKLQPVPADKSKYVEAGVQTYALPIMSSYLRSGQEFQDGTSMTHDYTNHYAKIYAAAVGYMNEQNKTYESVHGKAPNDAELAMFQKEQAQKMRQLESRMRTEYHEITSDVDRRIFTGKHNYVRDHIMAARLPHSATAVWTAEPNCDIDEIRMPSSMAKTLGKKEGDMVLGWRDPCLHRSNLAGMRVTIDDSLVGVAVNPLMAARMDGDFDGDSIGLYGVQSKAGLQDLNDKLAMHNTLLDLVHKDPETGDYALFINTKMDVRSLYARDEEARAKAEAEGHPMEGLSLRERFAEMEHRANDIYQGRGEWKDATPEAKDKANRALCNEVSQWTHDVFNSYPIGAQTLSMESPAAYLKDLQRMADTKAKGKAANIVDVAKYYGMSFEYHEDGSINYDTIRVEDHTLATRQDSKDTQYAVAVKANGTPLGGQVSLNFAELARNVCLIDGLDLTYNATQAVLQAKHDPVMAKQQYGMLQGPLKAMWRGRKLESHMEPVFADGLDEHGQRIPVLDKEGKQKFRETWTEARDPKGKPIPLTPEQWVNQFMQIHESPDGMNLAGDINREQVEFIAKSLTNGDGFVYNIEDEEVRHLLASPMDRLAYQPSLAATVEAARQEESLFEGAANEHLAPKVVRENIQKLQAFEAGVEPTQEQEASMDEPTAPELKGFGKSDTMEVTGTPKVSAYQTSEQYINENRKGIGNVVVGGYHEREVIEQPVVEESVEETVVGPTETTEVPVEVPTETPVEEPVKETVDTPVEVSVEQPVEESVVETSVKQESTPVTLTKDMSLQDFVEGVQEPVQEPVDLSGLEEKVQKGEMSLEDYMKEALTEEDYAQYRAEEEAKMKEGLPLAFQYSQEKLAEMYANMDASTPEELVSAAALAAQEVEPAYASTGVEDSYFLRKEAESEANRADDEDDIDDTTDLIDEDVSEHQEMSVNEDLRLDLAHQVSQDKQDMVQEPPFVEETGKDPAVIAEEASKQQRAKEDNKQKRDSLGE